MPPRTSDCNRVARRIEIALDQWPASADGAIETIVEASALLQGHSAKAIAAALTISPWTVRDHIKAIDEKTGVRSRPELVTLVPGAVVSA